MFCIVNFGLLRKYPIGSGEEGDRGLKGVGKGEKGGKENWLDKNYRMMQLIITLPCNYMI